MAQRPQLPAPGLMIPELRTPCPSDVFYRVLINRDDAVWRENNPIKRGTLYSSLKGADKSVSDLYPLLYFVSETVPIGSNTVAGMTQSEWVVWTFMTVPRAESATNAEMSFMGDSVSNPVFARVYTVRRDEFDEETSIATNTPFTGLIGLKKISGGQDYTHASGTLRGNGEDSDARVSFVIADGAVISGIVEDEGVGFDLNSSVDVIGDGTGAQFELILQPVGAVLTSQKKLEFPDDDPRQAEFVKVFRVYELLPGPYLPFTRYDDNLGPIQGRRRAVLNTGQQGGIVTNRLYRNYEARDGSSVVLWEIEERFSDGSGIPFGEFANPTYPLQSWSTYEPERGTVDHTSQLVGNEFAGHEASYVRTALPSGRFQITKTFYEPYSDNPANLAKRFIETWIEVLTQDFKISSEHGGGVITVSEIRGAVGAQVLDFGYLVTESAVKTLSPDEQVKHTEQLFGLPGAPESTWPVLQGAHTDEKSGIVLGYTKQVIPAGTPVPARSGYRGPFVEDTPYDRWKTIRIITFPYLDSLPPPEAWFSTRQFSLPPILLSIEAIWTDQVSYSAQGLETSVSVHASAGNRGGVIVTSRNGFRGHARCLVARDYTYGYFTPMPTPFKILPSSGSIIFIESTSSVSAAANDDNADGQSGNSGGLAFSRNGGQSGADFEQRVHEVDISDHLIGPGLRVLNPQGSRPGATASATSGGGKIREVGLLSGFALPWGAYMEVRLPYSTPTPEQLFSQPDNQILVDVTSEEWGYGIWVTTRYYIDLASVI